MSFIANYTEAFQTAYPQAKVEVSAASRNTYRIHVNGDPGDRTYSELEIRLATIAFRRGAPAKVYHRATAKLGDVARFVS